MNVTNFTTLKKIRIIKDETNIKNLVLLTISMRQILKKKVQKKKWAFLVAIMIQMKKSLNHQHNTMFYSEYEVYFCSFNILQR